MKMKATGIVRRVDELGRVVIPKEIRKIMGIREGEALEIFVEDKRVIFEKYEPMDMEKEKNKKRCEIVADYRVGCLIKSKKLKKNLKCNK